MCGWESPSGKTPDGVSLQAGLAVLALRLTSSHANSYIAAPFDSRRNTKQLVLLLSF